MLKNFKMPFKFQAGIEGVTPLIIMGGSSLFGGLLAVFLPETLGSKLPETLEDVRHVYGACHENIS
jgi:hypothetical protein